MVILFVYNSSYSVLHQVIALNQPQYILFPHTGDRFHDFEPIATSLFLERSDSVAHSQVVREACFEIPIWWVAEENTSFAGPLPL